LKATTRPAGNVPKAVATIHVASWSSNVANPEPAVAVPELN
jgi:hypothetical protein